MLSNSKIVLDLGSSKTKVLEVNPKKNILVINKAHTINNSELIDSFHQYNIHAKQVIFMFSNKLSNSALINIPKDQKKPNKYLQDEIKALVSNQIKYNIGCTYLGGNAYLIGYTSSDQVREIVLALKKVKKNVIGVDVGASAMIYFSNLYNEEDFETKIFFNIGHKYSEMLISHQGEFVKYNKFEIGSYHIIQDIKENIGAPHSRAIELINRLGLDKDNLPENADKFLDDLQITAFEYGSSVGERMKHFAETMVDAMRVNNQTFKAKKSKLILMGGSPLINGFESGLKNSLGITVETFSLMSTTMGAVKAVNNTNKKIDSSYAPIVGLALREVCGK